MATYRISKSHKSIIIESSGGGDWLGRWHKDDQWGVTKKMVVANSELIDYAMQVIGAVNWIRSNFDIGSDALMSDLTDFDQAEADRINDLIFGAGTDSTVFNGNFSWGSIISELKNSLVMRISIDIQCGDAKEKVLDVRFNGYNW